jgi:hypothetical protein
MATSINEHVVTAKINTYFYAALSSRSKGTHLTGIQSKTFLCELCVAIMNLVYLTPPPPCCPILCRNYAYL